MRPRALRRWRTSGALTASAIVLGAAAALSVPPGAGPTTENRLPDKPRMHRYPAFDAKGRRIGTASWRVTTAGGNCCEVLVAATPTGRLVEFGGTYPAYSDDKGRTWTEIVPLIGSTSRLPNPGPRQVVGGGEGTIVMAPNGDIVGIGWDPYTGDHLQSFLYVATEKKWYFQEAPLHEPFYDREWIAVAPGPFLILGQQVPWVSMVVSNFHRRVVLMSTDGLNYFTPTQRDLDGLRNQALSRHLDVVRDPQLDYVQGHSETGIVPLAGGGALSVLPTTAKAVTGCSMHRLRRDATWACFSLPGGKGFEGTPAVDSRGWIHVVREEATDIVYRLSKDGGKTWRETLVTLPGEPQIESWDFKAHGKLGLTAVAVHAKKDDGTFQDMVLRFDTRKGTIVHRDTLFVGNGNLATTAGLDLSGVITGTKTNRVDFATVAILPDGTIAAGFADRTYDDPALAILA